MKYIFLLLISVLSISCISKEKKTNTTETENRIEQKSASQIGQYVTGTFEDSKGHLWFGTIENGIARYDGNTLKYFTLEDGLPSNRVIGVIQDSDGIFWLKTGNGLSKYDGTSFTNFQISDDFLSNSISQLFIDSKGIFWVGTWAGVYQFNGQNFTYFQIPYPQIDTKINEDTKNWITEIKEDPEGNLWFARDGYGICRYDGKSFTHFLKKDGLHSNNVTNIEFDNKGNMWFGTRVAEKDNPDPKKRIGKGGVNKLTNSTFTSFKEIKGFNNGDVYDIHKDLAGNIWITTTENGVYKFDGKAFKNYNVPISIMSIMHDNHGNIWLGGAGGLYRINKDDDVLNVTTNGPWK